MERKLMTWSQLKKDLSYFQSNPRRTMAICELAKYEDLSEKSVQRVSKSLNEDVAYIREIANNLKS